MGSRRHPRKPFRSAKSFERKESVRQQYDYVLIVCEGKKTEPNYLQGLCAHYGLSNANIRILQPPGNDPMSIVSFAIDELNREGDYDRCYCVFDRDGHTNYGAALQEIKRSEAGAAGKLRAVVSAPCFEVWVLVHFVYSTAEYDSAGGVSACARVLKDVRKHFQGYTKGHIGVFDILMPNLDRAIINAGRLDRHNKATGSNNPATEMHMLVDYLRRLKAK
jgi:hypothetical protein